MKKNLLKNLIFVGAILVYIVFCFIQKPITSAVVIDGETAVGSMWSLLPPIIAIGLALITKRGIFISFCGDIVRCSYRSYCYGNRL